MKADLYTAQARIAGADGLAHRTAAGFVVLTSADGNNMIDLIDAKQNEANLIDQVVARAQDSGPASFAMLFTAGGELYLIAYGSATASVTTTTGQFTMGAAGDQVLVYPIHGGMGETTAAITLHVDGLGDNPSDGADTDMPDGTVPADSVGVSIGNDAVHRLTADMPKYQSPTDEADAAPAHEASEPSVQIPDVTEQAEAETSEDRGKPGAPAAGHVLHGGAADIEEPDVEPVAILPPTDEAELPGDPVVSEAAQTPEPPAPVPEPPMPPVPAAIPEPPAPATPLVPEPPMPPVPAAIPEPPAPVPEPPMPPAPAATDPAVLSQPAAIPAPPVPAPAEPVAAPEPAAIPDPPVPTPVAQEAVAQELAAPVPEPAPAPSEAAPVSPASIGPAMVLGIACSQHHHNHPDAVYCSQCGTKMGVHHTTVLINGPRPPLGVLVVDDGTTYSLNQDLVIGREPSTHDDVVAGTASPMILTDDTLSLSRKHARIVLDDWSVLVQDLGSSNGTFLSRAGQAENWTRITPSSTSPLEPGDRLRVGGRIIQVELHHVR